MENIKKGDKKGDKFNLVENSTMIKRKIAGRSVCCSRILQDLYYMIANKFGQREFGV